MSINDIDDDMNDAMLQHDSVVLYSLFLHLEKFGGALETVVRYVRKTAGSALSSSLSSFTLLPSGAKLHDS